MCEQIFIYILNEFINANSSECGKNTHEQNRYTDKHNKKSKIQLSNELVV